ncbi:MAG: T9SS type A sorting domain-containing protein [Bacteroidota bacterium]|nr:T9SS type A sorting domain-containing protein [Bacteroidota bacterium]
MRTLFTRFLPLFAGVWLCASTAQAQMARTVTLNLNMATVADTTSTMDMIEVRGAVKGMAPVTLADGNVIDWSEASTLEPTNVGGDYWQVQFQIADTTELTFKFYSQQTQDSGLNGWESDPNPVISPGTGDTTLAIHYFDGQSEWRGTTGPRGYGWRPFESKEDSIGVWFRVAMYGQESVDDGYDPMMDMPNQFMGVRGARLISADSSMMGPIDWGTSDVVLERESTSDSAPGWRVYSGVGYYPAGLAGMDQQYKFVLETVSGGDPATAWEEGSLDGNRMFTVPMQDTTLHWVYYGDTKPNPTVPVESNLVFGVNLEAFETMGLFDPARQDTLWVFGDFNNWQNCRENTPDLCYMAKEPGGTNFAAAVPITRPPGVELGYKYFLDFNDERFQDQFNVPPPSGWEEGHLTGINRRFQFAGDAQQLLDLAYFNDVTPQNLLQPGVAVTVNFSVNMDSALINLAQPFDPIGGDTVSVRLGDPIWAHTQHIDGTDHDIPLLDRVVLTDDNFDGIYTGSWLVAGPSYNILTFKYLYGRSGTYTDESGSDTQVPGRNRTHFITRNADGSWPSSYDLPAATFKVSPGPLPFERNPYIMRTAVEQTDQVPEKIWIEGNYPNPFNPTTTIEYGIDQTLAVRLEVYDVTGRRVSMLVDAVQQPATYRIRFDGSQLASGVYFYRLTAGQQIVQNRMILIK